jgi:hypothetical protein
MQRFRVYYFRNNVLEHSEELQVRDLLDALELARSAEPDVRAEIWSEKGKIGIIGPAPGSGG